MRGTHGVSLVALCGLLAAGCAGPVQPSTTPSLSTVSSSSAPTASTAPPAATTAPPASPTQRPVSVRCSDSIGGGELLSSLDVVLDAVALPMRSTVPAYAAEPGWLFAKMPLLARSEVPVELQVAPAAIGRAQIGWGPAGMGTRVLVLGCAPAPGWTAYAGGYQVVGPMCLPLLVRSAGREALVSVGIGVRCPPG
jgi:hypothetical protein